MPISVFEIMLDLYSKESTLKMKIVNADFLYLYIPLLSLTKNIKYEIDVINIIISRIVYKSGIAAGASHRHASYSVNTVIVL